jgi:hypothetical protein
MVVAIAGLVSLQGATRYLAPDGSDSGDALTELNSWRTLEYAIVTSSLASGDTLLLCAGIDGEPGIGLWDSTDVPTQAQPAAAKSGTPGDWTYILPDTGVTARFDGAVVTSPGDATAIIWQSQSSKRERWAIIGKVNGGRIQFVNWHDQDTLSSVSNDPVLYVENKYGDGTSITGFLFDGLEFFSDDPLFPEPRGKQQSCPIVFSSFSTSPYTDYIDSVTVSRCDFLDSNNDALVTARHHGLYVGDNTMTRRKIWWEILSGETNFGEPDGSHGDGLWMHRPEVYGGIVERNVVSGFDHGMCYAGQGLIVRNNVIHDVMDEFIWLHTSNPSLDHPVPTNCILRDNLCWRGGDDGVTLTGVNTWFVHNTLYHYSDMGIILNEGSLPGGSTAGPFYILGNIFAESTGWNEGDGTHPGAQIEATVSSSVWDYNLWHDRDGYKYWLDQSQSAQPVDELSEWQAFGYDANGIWANPAFVDSVAYGATPTLAPTIVSPLVGAGLDGRSIGAVPCFGCPSFSLSVTGDDPDSVRIEWWHPDGSEGDTRRDLAVSQWRDRAWIADIDEAQIGSATGAWSVYMGGSTTPEVIQDMTAVSAEMIASAVDLQLDDEVASLSDMSIGLSLDIADLSVNMALEFEDVPTAEEIAAVVAVTAVDSVRAVGTVTLTEQVNEWVTGTDGDPLTITVTDAATSATVQNATVKLFTDALNTSLHDWLMTGVAGTCETNIELGASYYYRAWRPGEYGTDTGTIRRIDQPPWTETIALTAIELDQALEPDHCIMGWQAVTGEGVGIDSIEVVVTWQGRGVTAGSGSVALGKLTGRTDINGIAQFDLYRSSEVVPIGAMTRWEFTDMRIPAVWEFTTLRDVTVPDAASAWAIDND